MVVNCFRSLYLWVDLQQIAKSPIIGTGCELLSFFVPLGWFTADIITALLCPGCELLSFFVPLGWFTAFCIRGPFISMLWIAFVLCTFGLIYSSCGRCRYSAAVVNCFRSLYLWVDLQRSRSPLWARSGCELLSFFVPLGWFTAAAERALAGLCCELLSFFVPLGWFTAHSLQNSMGQRVMNCNWKRKSRPLRAGISLFIIAVR